MLLSPRDEYALVNFGGALAAVVLGEDFPEWQVPGARSACGDHSAVHLNRIAWFNGRPILKGIATGCPRGTGCSQAEFSWVRATR